MSLDSLVCHEAVDLASPRVLKPTNSSQVHRHYDNHMRPEQQQIDCLNNDALPMCIEIPPFPDLSQYDSHSCTVASVASHQQHQVADSAGRDVSRFVTKMIEVDASEVRENSRLEGPPRLMLLEWLNELCCVLRLRRTTFYLTVDYIERFLAVRQNMNKGTLQLLAVTALWDAAKIEELVPPSVSDLAYVTDKAFTEQDILSLEVDLVRELSYVLSPHTVDNYIKLYLQAYNKHVKALRKRGGSLECHRRTTPVETDVVDSACSPSRLSVLPLLPSSTSISPEKSLTPQSPLRHNSSSSNEETEPSAAVVSSMPCVSRSRESREFNQLRHRFIPNHLFRPGAQPSTVPSDEANTTGVSTTAPTVFLDPSHPWRVTDENCSAHLSQIEYMFDDIACNSLWAHDCCGDYTWAPPYNVLLYVKAMRVIDLLLLESSWSYIPYAIWGAAVLYHLVGPTIISVIDFPVEHIGELDRAIIVSAPFVQVVYELGLPQMTALDAKQGDVKAQQRRAAMPYYVRTACDRSASAAAAENGGGGGEAAAAAAQSAGLMCLAPDERNLLELLYAAPKIESSFDVNESTPKLFERAMEISQQMCAARLVVKEKVYRGLFQHIQHAFQEVFDYEPLYYSSQNSMPTADSNKNNDDNIKADFNDKSLLTNFFQCDSATYKILSKPITQPFEQHRRLRQRNLCLQQRRNSQMSTGRQNSGRKCSTSPLVSTTVGGFALPITPQRGRHNVVGSANSLMSPPLTAVSGCKLPVSQQSDRNWAACESLSESRLMRRKLQIQMQNTPESCCFGVAAGSMTTKTLLSATKNGAVVESVFTPPDSGGKMLLPGGGGAAVRDELNDILQQEEAQQNFLSRRRSKTKNVCSRTPLQDPKGGVQPNNDEMMMEKKSLLSVRSTSSEDDVKFVEQRRSLRKVVVLNAANTAAAAVAADSSKKLMGPPPEPPAIPTKSATSRKRRSTSRNSNSSSSSTATSSSSRRVTTNNNNKQMKSDLTQTLLTPAAMPPPSAMPRPNTTTRAAAAARKAAAAGAANSSQTKTNMTLPEMWNMQTRNFSATTKK